MIVSSTFLVKYFRVGMIQITDDRIKKQIIYLFLIAFYAFKIGLLLFLQALPV